MARYVEDEEDEEDEVDEEDEEEEEYNEEDGADEEEEENGVPGRSPLHFPPPDSRSRSTEIKNPRSSH
jgi:hypothetical protein